MQFKKMHGLGNDFVIVDARGGDFNLTPKQIARISDRHFGVGCDQFVVIFDDEDVDARIGFWNSDGSVAGACGNATRCVADILLAENSARELRLKTARGLLQARRSDDGLIEVNMGEPVLNWQDIPLARDVNIDALPLEGAPSAVGMGNPHCVFFVENAEDVDVALEGMRYEHDPLYPERTNVEFISVIGENHLRMRVWERGGMITLACGSGACAALVAAHRRGLVARKARVTLDGGDLHIHWQDDGVWMKGETAFVFDGVLSAEMLDV